MDRFKMGWNLLAREYEEFERDLQEVVAKFHEAAIVGLQGIRADESAEIDELRRAAETEVDVGDADLEAKFKLEAARDRERMVGWLTLVYLVVLVEQRIHRLKSRFDNSRPQRKEGYKGQSRLDKLVDEFDDRFGIRLKDHPAFEYLGDLVLARNEVVHSMGRPREKYLKHTERFRHKEEFLRGDEDVIVFSNRDFKEAVDKMRDLIDWVVRQLMKVEGGREPDAVPLRSFRIIKAERV